MPETLSRAFATLASELNIARRNWSSYPANHPVIATSIQKLHSAWKHLLQQQTPLRLGITRDGFLFGDDYIEKGNNICKALASLLFERGLGRLVALREPELQELQAMLAIIAMKRENILTEGGIESIWKKAGIEFAEAGGIRYDRFSGTEEMFITEDSDGSLGQTIVWERFVRLLMHGDVGLVGTDSFGSINPEALAARLNASFSQRLGTGSGLSSSEIRGFASVVNGLFSANDYSRKQDAESTPSEADSTENAYIQNNRKELIAFICALDTKLRRQILDGFCEMSPGEDNAEAEQLFRHLSSSMLQDTYATLEEYNSAPKLVKNILMKFAPNLAASYEINAPQNKIREKVKALFQEHHHEFFIPDEYMNLIDKLSKEHQLRHIDPGSIKDILETLNTAAIQNRSSEIILQLVFTDPDGEDPQELINNLAEMCGHFLEMGDYGQVLRILEQAADPRLSKPLRIAMRDAFSKREFLDEILSGLTIWGKPKYEQVSRLIQIIGRPFIEPLLDKLSEEENMSLRRFMMDKVLAFGEAARPAILERLADQRWYVLRNIIVMLRTLAPGQEADRLRPFMKHGNRKVKQEALKSLLLAGDPIAQRQMLRDIDSPDRDIQLGAISLLDRNSPVEIRRKLFSALTDGRFSPGDCELKSAIINALSEAGHPDAIPELLKILASRSLLAFKALSRIKLEIVRSLEKYPHNAAIPVLEKISAGSDDLARQATESLKNIRSRST